MITFAISSAIALSSVFGAWGLIEVQKKRDRITESKQSEEEVDTNEKEEKLLLLPKPLVSPHNSTHSLKELDKSPRNENFDLISTASPSSDSKEEGLKEEEKEEQGTKKENSVSDLINLLELELVKKREEELQIRREQLTKLIEEERKRREQIEILEKEKLEQKKYEEKKRKDLGRQLFALAIDQSLRGKKKFPSHLPLSFEWNLMNIVSEFESKRLNFNGRYFECIPEGTLEFLTYHPRFIIDRHKNIIKLRYLTPYQGNAKVTGHFICSSCSRSWKSSASLKDTPFKCKHCNLQIYPSKQEDFDENELLETI
eukprot:gene4775-5125_t